MSDQEGMSRPILPKSVRLQEVFARLESHQPFTTFDEAYRTLVMTLEEVEDELTGIENNPENWRLDGRLYPPQPDRWHRVPGYPQVTRMRTRLHNVFIAANGAMEIQVANSGVVMFSKAGADGRGVWDNE